MVRSARVVVENRCFSDSIVIRTYSIDQLRGLISWQYFYYAWGVAGKSDADCQSLRKDADRMLDEWQLTRQSQAMLLRLPANSDGDDILLGQNLEIRIPMLRQQKAEKPGEPLLCLADFVRPLSQGIRDEIGVFCTSMGIDIDQIYASDPYLRMLAITLADRLAEATAEMISKEMPGIRPAVGYPVMPDMSLNFLLDDILDMSQIGITLTESGMMQPHSSVSGLVFGHPAARYFIVGPVGDDQLADYAVRRGYTIGEMKRFIK